LAISAACLVRSFRLNLRPGVHAATEAGRQGNQVNDHCGNHITGRRKRVISARAAAPTVDNLSRQHVRERK
jgi:hypothetical protein